MTTAAALVLLLTLTLTAGAASELPQLHCEAALVVAPETGFVLYSKNDLSKRSPSSLVKIMTALVVLENADDLSAEVTVSAEAVANLKGLATSSLKEGEVMTVTNLLYCLLLNSGADAANALAEYTAGSISDFVAMMNGRAAQLGMADTQFANPHGGDDAAQYTTAADLAKLAVAAMKNQQLRDIVEVQYKRIPKTNKTSTDRYYFSNNALVISSTERRKTEDYYYRYADGLMTGYSTAAGYNVLASSEKDGLTLVTVVLGATRDETTKEKYSYTDAIALMNWGYGNFKLAQLLTKLEPVAEAPVTLSSTTDSVILVAPEAYTAIIPADVEPAAMSREVTVAQPLEAPVAKGEAVGTVIFSYGGLEYGRSPLVSQSEIERSFLLFALARISGFLVGPWLYVSVGGLLILGGLYAFLTVRLNRRRGRGGRYRG
ncbi:MAG TPA: D-alanyl-D-alanine carboxypeptidase family protein [Candidatus Acidoferrum sp.]|nr:D-alanyl-D-alanine carboxypeptidase family protein [Candidatus Acidoferrum sp.]